METVQYEALRSAEESWWYRGRTYAVARVLKRFAPAPGAVLDLGAGYGAMFPFLQAFGPVTAYELYPECIEACRTRGYHAVCGTEDELFSAPPFALIGAFDVLEHIEDDVAFLSRLRNNISPDGMLVATVPAHQFLWSKHDDINRHFRRHSKKTLRELFAKSGYDVMYLSYWNCALFLPAMLMRLAGGEGAGALMPPRWINAILTTIVYFESLWLAFAPLPLGVSLTVVARPSSRA